MIAINFFTECSKLAAVLRTYPVFRPDGECNHNFIDKILSPRLCAALFVETANEETTVEQWPVLMKKAHQPLSSHIYVSLPTAKRTAWHVSLGTY